MHSRETENSSELSEDASPAKQPESGFGSFAAEPDSQATVFERKSIPGNSEQSLEGRVALWALGCLCVLGGTLIFLISFGCISADVDANAEAGYLRNVYARSLLNPFQGGLFVGVLAVPLHAVLIFVVAGRRGRALVSAYDRFSQWAQVLFTSLGFMGTIIGISLAVSGLRDAMTAGEPGALIQGLSTAFDTTFLGLSGAVLLMVVRKLAQYGSR